MVLPVLEHFLDTTMILGSLSSRIVRPGDGQQDFHGDIPENMLNLPSPVMMNTVWMLEDFSAEIGGTRIVPGSHKSGLAGPPEGMEVRHVVQPEAPAGSVLIFNGQCWHGGGTNTSDRDRYALFGHYRKSMLMFQLDPHDDFLAEWVDRLFPRQKPVSARCTLPIYIWRERLREQTAAADEIEALLQSRLHARLTPAATGA